MKSLRPENVKPGEPRYRVSYTKPAETEDGKPCRCYCAEDDPDADEAIVELNGIQYHEWRFAKIAYSGGEERWDHNMQRLLRAFQVAFDQGVAFQRVAIRDTLREVIGL